MDSLHIPAHGVIGLQGLAAGLLAWGSLSYGISKAYKGVRCPEYAARLISLLHSIVSLIACFAAVRMYPESDFCSDARTGEILVVANSAAYFMVDTLSMWLTGAFDPMFAVHHVAAVVSLAIPLFSGVSAHEVIIVLFLLETSNPVMHSYWLLQEHIPIEEKESSRLLSVGRVLFVALFFASRILVGPWLAVQVTTRSCCWWIHCVIGNGFMAFNLAFFMNLLKTVLKGDPAARW
jgi:hypothetical protein